jgi:hypothetical protein
MSILSDEHDALVHPDGSLCEDGCDRQPMAHVPLKRYELRNTRTYATDRSYRLLSGAIRRWYELGGRLQGWRIFDLTTDALAEGTP